MPGPQVSHRRALAERVQGRACPALRAEVNTEKTHYGKTSVVRLFCNLLAESALERVPRAADGILPIDPAGRQAPRGKPAKEEPYMKKRLLAVLLACCMAAGMANAVFAADELPATAESAAAIAPARPGPACPGTRNRGGADPSACPGIRNRGGADPGGCPRGNARDRTHPRDGDAARRARHRGADCRCHKRRAGGQYSDRRLLYSEGQRQHGQTRRRCVHLVPQQGRHQLGGGPAAALLR